jgi:hypothetical protein
MSWGVVPPERCAKSWSCGDRCTRGAGGLDARWTGWRVAHIFSGEREACGECADWTRRHHAGGECGGECARGIGTTLEDLRGEGANVEQDQALRVITHW